MDKRTGGMCLSISSRPMSITEIDDGRYWNRIPTDESRAMARLGTRCLSAVSAYDNTLEIIDTFNTAQAKFNDILSSPSLDVAYDKIKSLAKAKELDSSLILLINSASASAKESKSMKNEKSDALWSIKENS